MRHCVGAGRWGGCCCCCGGGGTCATGGASGAVGRCAGDTIGGLIFNTLERAPRKGEVIQLPGYDLTCVDVSGSRIARVRIEERPDAGETRDVA